jgi:hypothetical protein
MKVYGKADAEIHVFLTLGLVATSPIQHALNMKPCGPQNWPALSHTKR